MTLNMVQQKHGLSEMLTQRKKSQCHNLIELFSTILLHNSLTGDKYAHSV